MNTTSWTDSSRKQPDTDVVIPKLRSIGLVATGSREWVGGEIYILNLFSALLKYRDTLPVSCRYRIVVLTSDADTLLNRYPIYQQADSLIRVAGSRSGLLGKLWLLWVSRREGIEYLYPFNAPLPSWWGIRGAAWIADFQHETYPELFSPPELQALRRRVGQIASWSQHIVFSSRAADRDFRRLYPTSKANGHLLHFHTSIDPGLFDEQPEEIQKKYNLPHQFLICSGQLWKHKNHLLLLDALAIAREQEASLFMVFTGHANDPRDLAHLDRFLAKLSCLDLRGVSALLGLIPRQDQLQLIRRAVAVVQPSLFEGWSTVVEDARALAKGIVLSDIDVHVEQQHPDACYFKRFSAESLAAQILSVWNSHMPGPNHDAEKMAMRQSQHLSHSFAQSFIRIMNTTVSIKARRKCSDD